MWVARQSKIWTGGCTLCLLLLAPVAPAGSDVKVEFVNPPANAHPGDDLALRISGTPPPDAELRVYGLANHSPDRNYEKNQTILLTVVRGRELLKPSIPVPKGNASDLLEVTAVLTMSDGSSISTPARLSLSSAKSAQAAPPALQQLMKGASGFLDRLLGLYDSVRAGPEDPRAVFVATLEPGKTLSVDTLGLDRAQYHALALSSHGDRIAWTVEQPEGYELWTSKVSPLEPVRLASSSRKISTPVFADQNALLFVNGNELMFADLATASVPHHVKAPFRSVSRIYCAQRDGPWITAVVRAQHPDAPGIELSYLTRISADESRIETVPLADNSFYESYSQFVEGSPFFYAGSVQGVEGIYSLQPNDSGGEPMQVYKIQSPGLVALSANGKKLAFVGSP
jgi:hypothetical protein